MWVIGRSRGGVQGGVIGQAQVAPEPVDGRFHQNFYTDQALARVRGSEWLRVRTIPCHEPPDVSAFYPGNGIIRATDGVLPRPNRL